MDLKDTEVCLEHRCQVRHLTPFTRGSQARALALLTFWSEKEDFKIC
jgi:hypothetical protein